MKPKKLYRCPKCGDVVTEETLEERASSGGHGYCYCEFMARTPDGDVWFPRHYIEYDVYHLSGETVNE